MVNYCVTKDMPLKQKTEMRVEILHDWYKRGQHLLTRDLARILGVSVGHAHRLKKRYKKKQLKYKPRISNNRIAESVRDEIVAKYEKLIIEININPDANEYSPTLKKCYEKLDIEKEYEICYASFVNILTERNIFAKSSHRKTRRRCKANIKQQQLAKNRKKDSLFEDVLKKQEKKKHVPILRKKQSVYGQINEMDACQHDWFRDGKKNHLYANVDSATGFLLDIHMEKEETGLGYFYLSQSSFQKYGVPEIIKTDKKTCFWNGEEANSSIAKMFKWMGADVQVSSNPMSKPNVERSFKNMQQEFTYLFWENNATSCEEVNKNKQFYIDAYNKKYNKKPTETNAFTIVDKQTILEKMKFEKIRKVLKGNYLALNKEKYVPVDLENKRILMPENSEITILYSPTEDYHIYLNNQKFALKTISEADHVKFMTNYYKEKDLAFETRKARSFQLSQSKQIQKLENQNKYLLKKLKELNL